MKNKVIFLIIISVYILYSPFLNVWQDTGDSAEFVLSGYFLGNSHPSGYPLYNIISKLFLSLPGNDYYLKLSIMSLFFASITAIFLFLTLEVLSENVYFAFLGVFAFLSGKVILGISLSQEAYSAYLCFFSAALYFFIKAYVYSEIKSLYLAFFSLGLMTAVHITGFFYFFIFLFVSFFIRKRFYESYKIEALKLFLYFLIPNLVYLYLFFRNDALFSWGEVKDLKTFFYFVSGKERNVGNRFFKMPLRLYFYQLTVILKIFMKEFSFLWAFLVPGVYFTFKKDRIFSFALIFPAVFNILFFSFVARDLTEKGHFFSVALFVFFIFCWQGLFFVYSFLFKNKKPYFLIAIPIFLFFLNKPDFSYGAIFENYEDNVIKTLSKFKNEKVLFTEGDEITFGLLVKKYVKKALNNTEIVNKDMLNAKWYAKKHGTYEKILEKYKFDVFFDTYPQNIYKYYVLPVGILYKIEDKYKKIDVSYFKDYVFGELDAKNVKEAEVIVKRYADAFNNAGLCLVKEGNYAEAKLFFETAIKISPDISYFTNLSKAVKKEKFYKDEIQELEDKKYFKRLIYYLKKEKNYEKISEVYFKLGKYDELKKIPVKTQYLGIYFFKTGKYEKAYEILKNYDTRDSLFYIALIYLKKGKIREATEILENLRLKYQNDEEIYEVLKRVKGYVDLYGKF